MRPHSAPELEEETWKGRGAFPRKSPFSFDDVYHALTYLDDKRDELVAHTGATLEAPRGPRDTCVLYYDVANHYLEAEGEDGFRMRGVSKKHRPSPIVQMGLFLDTDGMPLDYMLFPGNVPDVSALVPAMEKAGMRFGPDPRSESRGHGQGLQRLHKHHPVRPGRQQVRVLPEHAQRGPQLKEWVLSAEGYIANEAGTYRIKSCVGEKAVYVTRRTGGAAGS